jgi:hypothetical protein
LCGNDSCAVLRRSSFSVVDRFWVRSPMARSRTMDASAPRKSLKTTCPEDNEQNLGEGSFGRDPLTFIDCREAAAGSSAIPATVSAKQAVNPSLRSQLVSHFGNSREQKSKVSAASKFSCSRTSVVKLDYGSGCDSCRPSSGRFCPNQGFGIVPVGPVDVGNRDGPMVCSS